MNLHYTKRGSGPALFILHGLYGSGDNWHNIGKDLGDYFTVYLIDHRNHGRSPHSAAHNYEEMAADLRNICNKENLKCINIIGHSMGGKVGMTFTLSYPGIVEKLINVDISPFGYLNNNSNSPQFDQHKQILETFANAPIANVTSRAEMEKHFALTVPEMATRRFLLKNLKRDNLKNFYWQLNVSVLQNNLEHIVDSVPPVNFGTQSFIPVLFIKGGKSPYLKDDDIKAIPDIFPNSNFETFENSGHWLHAEEPKKFLSLVKSFLLA